MGRKGERRRVKKVPMVGVVERFNWWKLHLSEEAWWEEEDDEEDWGEDRTCWR